MTNTVYRGGSDLITTPVILDAGPLGRVIHPRSNREIVAWMEQVLGAGVEIIVPKIADYEVRRNLILEGLTTSLHRLDRLKEVLVYLPLNTETMLKAAELWAQTRRHGYPTADSKALDGDVILAAQSILVGVTIATENVSHLARFTQAKHWRELVP